MITEIKITARTFLTKPNPQYPHREPLPMRTMVGTIERETAKAVFVHLHGRPEPSSSCLHCGRTLTHPVSLLYGIGPVCGQHFHISPVSESELDDYMNEIREKLEAIEWTGWLPKSCITIEDASLPAKVG